MFCCKPLQWNPPLVSKCLPREVSTENWMTSHAQMHMSCNNTYALFIDNQWLIIFMSAEIPYLIENIASFFDAHFLFFVACDKNTFHSRWKNFLSPFLQNVNKERSRINIDVRSTLWIDFQQYKSAYFLLLSDVKSFCALTFSTVVIRHFKFRSSSSQYCAANNLFQGPVIPDHCVWAEIFRRTQPTEVFSCLSGFHPLQNWLMVQRGRPGGISLKGLWANETTKWKYTQSQAIFVGAGS